MIVSKYLTVACRRSRSLKSASIAGLFIFGIAASAHAETLDDALRDASASNPALKAERERLLATNQSITSARAGFLPNISASAQAGWQENRFAGAPDQALRQKPYGWSVTLEQPIFDGGAAVALVRRATENVRAGRQIVALTESDVLLAAATAYSDVLQARAILRIQVDSLAALETLDRMTRERRSVGDVAVSEAAQSEAAVTGGHIQLDMARSTVANAESQFLLIVGRAPGKLAAPAPINSSLPKHLDGALQRALAQHPALRAASHREASARHAIDVANAKHLPTLSLQASYNSRRDFDGLPSPGDVRAGATIQAVARVPIYSGGSIEAEVEAARHQHLSLVHELAQQRAAVRNAVTQAWASWQQVGARSRLLGQQIDASNRALAGLRKEQSIGQRTLSDVLAAERDLLAARVALEQAKRQATVAAYALVASMGELSMQSRTAEIPARAPSLASGLASTSSAATPAVRRATSESTRTVVDRAGWTTTLHTAAAAPRQ